MKTTQPNTIKWDEVRGAMEYVIRISREGVIYRDSLVGNENKTSVEIPHSSLNFTSKEPPPSVEVNIEVLAVDESEVIGRGQLIEFSKCFHCFLVLFQHH